MKSTIELFDYELDVVIGTYKDDEIVPDKHILDLTLLIEPSLVIIEKDTMDEVFDYDPLIKCINTLAKGAHYETQEMLITLIVKEGSLELLENYIPLMIDAILEVLTKIGNGSEAIGNILATLLLHKF